MCASYLQLGRHSARRRSLVSPEIASRPRRAGWSAGMGALHPVDLPVGYHPEAEREAPFRDGQRCVPKLNWLQPISPGNDFEFAENGLLNLNDGSDLEYESWKHRTKLVNGHQIVAFH
jgi:hypothetical protein